MSKTVKNQKKICYLSSMVTSVMREQIPFGISVRGIDLIALLVLVILVFLPGRSVGAEDAPDRVTIPLPEGQNIVFRAVYLGIDGKPMFNSREVRLGSLEGGPNTSYKQIPTKTLLAGSFVGTRDGRPDWLYYLGETEVQENQWNAVLRWHDKEKGMTPRPAVDSKLPQTEVTVAEIYQFIEALNTWMLSQARDKLPTYRGALAFCRLPTEAEWAFAARGGIEVSDHVFNRPHPYGEDLGDYEWYRNTSGNRVQECGSPHTKPNPLGLFDMLGNVEELTLSLYGPEYQQGRFGHHVIRGGNFSTGRTDLSVTRRTEAQSHDNNGQLIRSLKEGFRLALSTRVSSVRATPDDFDRELKDYSARRGLTRPGPVGASSPVTQAEQDRQSLLEDQLQQQQADNQRLLQQIAGLEEDLRKVRTRSGTTKGFTSHASELAWLKKKIVRKDQELEDLRQRASRFAHEIKKNVGRVRSVEKRYLEALMRQASANAYLAWRTFTALKFLPAENRVDDLHQRKWTEGSQMVHDYWALVLKIAEDTQADLFVEVKRELADWLRRREEKGAAGRQRKALDLLERHVSDVRAGRYHRPEDLVRSFPDEPELK